MRRIANIVCPNTIQYGTLVRESMDHVGHGTRSLPPLVFYPFSSLGNNRLPLIMQRIALPNSPACRDTQRCRHVSHSAFVIRVSKKPCASAAAVLHNLS